MVLDQSIILTMSQSMIHVIQAITQIMQQYIWICLGCAILITIMACSFVSFWRHRVSRHRKEREISSVISQFVEERSKSEAILADLDVGVLAFGSDGTMINTNPAARKILQSDNLPVTLKEFIDHYGAENGIQAALLLGTDHVIGKCQVQDRIIRIRLKDSRFDEGRRAGTLVVLQDITDQEREEKQRKDFVANVSHELKTPLTTIKTYSESLLDWGLAEKNTEGVRKDIWRIHDDALRMERLVEDLLLLSSIDSRGIRTRMEQQDFPYMIRQTVERMQHQAMDKELTLTCYTLAKIPDVFVDRTSIERVMTNLLSNAIKYTERGGEIKVYIGYLVDDVYVKVTDTGFGIDKEHVDRIFNRFYRVDMTGSRMYGGTGLGLSIAKELVELHHGKISVSSVLGKGTEFTVMIPVAQKVFRDILSTAKTGTTNQDVLYHAAADELLTLARAMKMTENQLTDLDDGQCEALLGKTIYNEENEEDMDTPDQGARHVE